MKINGKEITLGHIASILTIIATLSAGTFFVHGYFAKSDDIVEMKEEILDYRTLQLKQIFRLKQEAQLNTWTTEQTFIVIRKDTILDRLGTESRKAAPDTFQINRWEDQLSSLTAREAEIKTSKESLRIQMLSD